MIGKVLVPVDFSEVSSAVVKSAKFIGNAFKPKFYLLHVISPLVYISVPETMVVDVIDSSVIEEIEETKKKRAKKLLEKIVKEFEGFQVETFIDIGSPADVIAEKEEELGVDLTILGGHQKGLVERILLGSTSEAVVKHSRKPVLVVKGHPIEKLSEVAIAYDFSEMGDALLSYAKGFLKPFRSKVTLIHVEEEIDLPILEKLGIDIIPQIREKKGEKLNRIKEEFEGEGLPCEVVYLESQDPAEGIVKTLHRGSFDMVMVANKGLSGLKRILMGSVSLEILRKSPIPVLVYKKED
ncbi:MAG: universal stress protein [Gammaproteobacteria bacterium]|nr:MAG: universal stress protein [Gammaproteobacteria bacterium]